MAIDGVRHNESVITKASNIPNFLFNLFSPYKNIILNYAVAPYYIFTS